MQIGLRGACINVFNSFYDSLTRTKPLTGEVREAAQTTSNARERGSVRALAAGAYVRFPVVQTPRRRRRRRWMPHSLRPPLHRLQTIYSDATSRPHDVQTTSNTSTYTEHTRPRVLLRIRRRKKTTLSAGSPYGSRANVLIARVKYVLMGPQGAYNTLVKSFWGTLTR